MSVRRGVGEVAPEALTASTTLTVTRGLQVLRAFDSSRMPMSNAELVRRTGFSKATVSRLTTTLMHRGYLKHAPGSRQFILSAGPVAVGHAFIEANPLMQIARQPMQDLADRLGLSVALAIDIQLEMLYVGYCVSRRVSTLRMGVGSLIPMGTSAAGRAWLWGLDAAERRGRLIALRPSLGQHSAEGEVGLRRSFAELEATGVCAVLGGVQRDAYAIAAPLRLGVRKVLMALSCGAVNVQIDLDEERERVGPFLRETAAKLEELLADLDDLP